jgi:hypothetical protein
LVQAFNELASREEQQLKKSRSIYLPSSSSSSSTVSQDLAKFKQKLEDLCKDHYKGHIDLVLGQTVVSIPEKNNIETPYCFEIATGPRKLLCCSDSPQVLYVDSLLF